jgi:hypothetical protein
MLSYEGRLNLPATDRRVESRIKAGLRLFGFANYGIHFCAIIKVFLCSHMTVI